MIISKCMKEHTCVMHRTMHMCMTKSSIASISVCRFVSLTNVSNKVIRRLGRCAIFKMRYHPTIITNLKCVVEKFNGPHVVLTRGDQINQGIINFSTNCLYRILKYTMQRTYGHTMPTN